MCVCVCATKFVAIDFIYLFRFNRHTGDVQVGVSKCAFSKMTLQCICECVASGINREKENVISAYIDVIYPMFSTLMLQHELFLFFRFSIMKTNWA